MSDYKKQALQDTRRKISEVIKKQDSKIVFGYTSKEENRQEGEVWEDHDGKKWTVKNGIKQSISKLQDAKTPWFCPVCENIMRSHLDDKFYTLRGKCFDCAIREETQMKLDGTWEAYEKHKIRQNEISYLKDKLAEQEDYLRVFTTPKAYFEDGRFEELAPIQMFEPQFEKTRADIQFIKERLKALYKAEEEYNATK